MWNHSSKYCRDVPWGSPKPFCAYSPPPPLLPPTRIPGSRGGGHSRALPVPTFKVRHWFGEGLSPFPPAERDSPSTESSSTFNANICIFWKSSVYRCASESLSACVYTYKPGTGRQGKTLPSKHNKTPSWSQVFFQKTPWEARLCRGPFCFLTEWTQGTAPNARNRKERKTGLWQ